jgi:outer membrane beta-barrel protein
MTMLPTAKALSALLSLLACACALAADPPASPPQSEQVVVPQVDRRDIRLPSFPSNDFELSLFGGVHSTQNFGASGVGGFRVAYHVTEDYFVEASLGRTKVSDAAFRRVLPGGIFTNKTETMQAADVSVGVNVLPGEVFFGRERAMPYYLYLLGGVGSTRFNDKRHQTFNLGMGMKVFARDWFAMRVDLQDHVFTLDLLGKPERTHNFELTTGLSFLF